MSILVALDPDSIPDVRIRPKLLFGTPCIRASSLQALAPHPCIDTKIEGLLAGSYME
jgi:hypothetical protein